MSFTVMFEGQQQLARQLGLLPNLNRLNELATRGNHAELTQHAATFLSQLASKAVERDDPLVWDQLRALLAAQVSENKRADQASVQAALARLQQASNIELVEMLKYNVMAEFLAHAMLGYVMPEKLTMEEQAEYVAEKYTQKSKEDWGMIAGQANYDNWKRVGKMIYNMLSQVLEMCAKPRSRAEVEEEKRQREANPQKAPPIIMGGGPKG